MKIIISSICFIVLLIGDQRSIAAKSTLIIERNHILHLLPSFLPITRGHLEYSAHDKSRAATLYVSGSRRRLEYAIPEVDSNGANSSLVTIVRPDLGRIYTRIGSNSHYVDSPLDSLQQFRAKYPHMILTRLPNITRDGETSKHYRFSNLVSGLQAIEVDYFLNEQEIPIKIILKSKPIDSNEFSSTSYEFRDIDLTLQDKQLFSAPPTAQNLSAQYQEILRRRQQRADIPN